MLLMAEEARKREDSRPRWDAARLWRFHHAAQNGAQFKTYELFLKFFHLIF